MKIIPRTWFVERRDSDVVVSVEGQALVTIHYLYGVIDNARQWQLAKSIVQSLAHEGDAIAVQGSVI